MATSRKGSTTPKDLKDDAGGLVAGGGPDLSGAAMPPAKPASAKPASAKSRSKPAEGADKSSSVKATGTEKPVAKPRSKASSSTAGGLAPHEATGSPTAQGGTGQSSSTPGTGGAAESSSSGPGETAAGDSGSTRMSDEERQRRIAEAAYRKAQERGFVGDRHLDDWLEAEREHNETQGRSR